MIRSVRSIRALRQDQQRQRNIQENGIKNLRNLTKIRTRNLSLDDILRTGVARSRTKRKRRAIWISCFHESWGLEECNKIENEKMAASSSIQEMLWLLREGVFKEMSPLRQKNLWLLNSGRSSVWRPTPFFRSGLPKIRPEKKRNLKTLCYD